MSILRSQIIVLVFLVAGLLGGCGKETQVETVELWHAYRGAEKEAIDRLAADFNANQGDYQLEVLAVASKAYKSKLTSAIPRGNGPDLFIEAHELVGEWARSSLIQPVSPEVELERFTERSVDALRFEGETWAVPLALKSLALFRNRSLVPDAPATFEDALSRSSLRAASVRLGNRRVFLSGAVRARLWGPSGPFGGGRPTRRGWTWTLDGLRRGARAAR